MKSFIIRRASVVSALTLTAAALATAVSSSAQAAPYDEAFYTPPAQLPSANGQVIRSEPQKLAVTIEGQDGGAPGTGTRIMYKSTDAAGRAVAVTGSYLEPAKRWTGSGPRPLVAFAAGTQGQGDLCAPSKQLSSTIDVRPGALSAGYEVPAIYGLLDQGIAVVVTDYIGLGTPDRLHTYTTRTDVGNALLDAARAARNLPGTSLTSSSPIGLYGYSQGGGATGAAAELAPSYAPELNIKGAYVGAPPADLLAVLKKVDGTLLTGVIGYAINGLLEYSPELRTILDRETNQAGKDALAKVQTQCTVDTALGFGFKKTSEWTTNGKSAAEVVEENPAALAIVEKQRLGKVKAGVPTLVVTGTQDDIVDHAQAKKVAQNWCSLGSKVEYAPAIQVVGTGGTGLNHITPIFSEAGKARSYLIDRFNGKSAPSNCALLPILP